MNNPEIKVLDQFLADTSNLIITPYGKGHINNTYKVKNDKGNVWLLQKINTSVFKNPYTLINNHLELLKHYYENNEIEVPKLINEKNNQYLIGNDDIGYWRLLNFFKNTTSIENLSNAKQAEQAGLAFGSFVQASLNCEISNFKEPIPNFHSLPFRFSQFQEAIKLNKANRNNDIKEIIDFYISFYQELKDLEIDISNQKIPIRIVHNDTKINNLLFRNDAVVAIIDLDTVGPGNILYDYGDALRTLANETDEDQKDLAKVKFSIKWFQAFTKGYAAKITNIISNEERNWLWQAPFLMTYIMGIRFLTDYLNGNIYYKIKYDNHNLIRSKVQKALIEDMLLKKEEIKQTIANFLHNL
jgi:thiamine kinase-like enzyme